MPGDGALAADLAFAAAIVGLCQHSASYYLAHGMLDYAKCLGRLDDDGAAGATIGQARDTVGRLRCQPLLDHAAAPPQNRGSGTRW